MLSRFNMSSDAEYGLWRERGVKLVGKGEHCLTMTATSCRNHLDTLQPQLLGSMLTKGMGKQWCDCWNEQNKEIQIIKKMVAVCYSILQLKVKGYGRNVFACMEGKIDLTFDISPRWRHFDLWQRAVVWPMHLGRLIGCPLPYTGEGAGKKKRKGGGPRPPSYPAFLFAHVAQRIKSWWRCCCGEKKRVNNDWNFWFFEFFSGFFFQIVIVFFLIYSFFLRFYYHGFYIFVIFDPNFFILSDFDKK